MLYEVITLPLLSFSLEQTPNTVDLVADAASFTTVASTPLYQQIARNLDAVAPSATGDFDTMMGTLQSLNGGFDAAFATFRITSYNVCYTKLLRAASAAVSFTAAGVAVAGGNVWDGGTKGDARAAAIDLGTHRLENVGDISYNFV